MDINISKSKVICVNPLSDFSSRKPDTVSWNTYIAPSLLRDFLVSKEINADFINLNDEFIKAVYSEPFFEEFLEKTSQEIKKFESLSALKKEELQEYLSLKLLLEAAKNGGEKMLEKAEWSIDKLPRYAVLLMKGVDVSQGGHLKVRISDEDLRKNIENFDKVMSAVLSKHNLDNALIVFSIPAKNHLSSVIQTGRLMKNLYPSCKIVIGGSYVKLVARSLLDDMVANGIIDFYIKDADEGKLLSLAKEFSSGGLGNFRGEYTTKERVTINDIKKTTSSGFDREFLLLSNGCYWGKCRYCEFAAVNQKFEVKSVNTIMGEIEHFYKMGKTKFCLLSDCLVPELGVRIAREILKRGIKIEWDSSFIRIDPGYTKDVFILLKESGFNFERVSVGMESCIDSALEIANKGYNRQIIENFVDAAKQAEIFFFRMNIILDLPGARAKDFMEMKEFVLKLLDVSRCVLGGSLYLSEYIEFGKNPEKYGIKLIGVDETAKDRDTLIFKFSDEEYAQLQALVTNFYSYVDTNHAAYLRYPAIDVSKLSRMTIYTEKECKLMIKTCKSNYTIDSEFNESGEKEKSTLTIPSESTLIQIPEFSLLKMFDKLKPETWYSVGEITELMGYSDKFSKLKMMQQVFRRVLMLIVAKGCSDAKTVNVNEINAENIING